MPVQDLRGPTSDVLKLQWLLGLVAVVNGGLVGVDGSVVGSRRELQVVTACALQTWALIHVDLGDMELGTQGILPSMVGFYEDIVFGGAFTQGFSLAFLGVDADQVALTLSAFQMGG